MNNNTGVYGFVKSDFKSECEVTEVSAMSICKLILDVNNRTRFYYRS